MALKIDTIQPAGWKKPSGYSNGVLVTGSSRLLFVAGQVAWDAEQRIVGGSSFSAQFEQALRNLLAVLACAGGRPEHVARITAYCCDKPAYLAVRRELGAVWRRHMGQHYPAMSMIFVSDLLDHPGKIELEATAVIPA